MTAFVPLPRGAGGTAACLRRFVRDEHGVSAIEFALLAPFLFFAAAATLDLGLALYERMTMDRLLRGGAQAAMSDPGAAAVRTVVEASAEDDFAPGVEFTLTVERYCACPADTGVAVVCTNPCADGGAPGIFYRLEGAREYPGMVLPAMALEAEAKVQIR
ncbi:MAG TPA: TadE/TadG family type IV pilus assembly protein [Thermohalobaculum sp.]|nr:TadE/TadG family type IV pilus assembly protein [Thermohalobaculum sp.]